MSDVNNPPNELNEDEVEPSGPPLEEDDERLVEHTGGRSWPQPQLPENGDCIDGEKIHQFLKGMV